VTEPNAKVAIDGVNYGTTPSSGTLVLPIVPAGRKTIRVRADGFAEARKVLLPSQSGKVAIPLSKATDNAELAFQSGTRLSLIDRQKAIAAFEEAAKLRPSYADAYISLARIYSDTGETEKAQAAIARARRSRAGLAEASAIEGRVLKSIGEEEKAIAAFKRAIREGAGFQPEAYTGLGMLYKERAESAAGSGEADIEAKNYAEAERYFRMALDQLAGAEDSVTLYQLLGLIYEEQKKPAKAIALYEEFLKIFPENPESEAFRSFIVQLKKQYPELK
jgi:tetratricopeptide (TPR) repeat protein